MFCETANEEISRIHKRGLRRLYNDFNSNFEEPLARSGETTVHLQNLEKLLLEVFKSLHQINPAFMWELFERKEVNYNLRNKDLLRIPKFQTITYGANSISYVGSYLWNSIPDVVKSCERHEFPNFYSRRHNRIADKVEGVISQSNRRLRVSSSKLMETIFTEYREEQLLIEHREPDILSIDHVSQRCTIVEVAVCYDL